MALTPGTRLGPYEVVALIGRGGMGEVYRARDTKLGRDVALKILPDAFMHDPERLARFQREAQVLASLNHPNIAAIYGLEEADGIRALVLELVEGPTLAERISGVASDFSRTASGPAEAGPHKESGLPLDETLRIARQIADALEAEHEKGVIHRDLKPANVKVTPEGRVKVLDFGLAKLVDPVEGGASLANSNSPTLSMQATQAGVIMGTAAYMSPEQARGRVSDKRTDIWAFGCVLFELLTGTRTFDGEDLTDIISSVVKSEPDWNALPADVPEQIRLLLKRCLAKDRRTRVSDISVARFLMTETIAAPPVPASEPAAAVAQTTIPPDGRRFLMIKAVGWWCRSSLRPAADPHRRPELVRGAEAAAAG